MHAFESPRPVRWLLFLGVTGMLTASAEGQPQFNRIDSLEWMAADSKAIVRAVVVDVTREPADHDWEFWDTVTVEVLETLKGTPRAKVTFVVNTLRSDEELARWKQQRQELLLFLVEGKLLREQGANYARHELAPRPHWKRSSIELGSGATPHVLTMDFGALTDPKPVLERTRAAIAATAKAGQVGKHVVRRPVSSWRGAYVYLTVPADRRLETEARRWIESPDDSMPKTDEPAATSVDDSSRLCNAWWPMTTKALRAEGIKALRHFKSDENVALMKSLLDDPASYRHTVEEGEWTAIRRREYFLRQEAFTTLKQWSVEVAQPVLAEELFRKVTDPKERAAITRIEALGGDIEYYEIEGPGPCAGRYRTVRVANLCWEPLHDLSPLATLANVEMLFLDDTGARDLAPLAKLSRLKHLELGGTRVRDLSALAGLKNLERLEVDVTLVADLTPLANLTKLKDLSVYGGYDEVSQVHDVSPLAKLSHLEYLNLSNTKVSRLEPLAQLTGLRSLHLQDTSVRDIRPLAKLKRLAYLELTRTPVSDLSPLKGLKHLWSVGLAGTSIDADEVRRFEEGLRARASSPK